MISAYPILLLTYSFRPCPTALLLLNASLSLIYAETRLVLFPYVVLLPSLSLLSLFLSLICSRQFVSCLILLPSLVVFFYSSHFLSSHTILLPCWRLFLNPFIAIVSFAELSLLVDLFFFLFVLALLLFSIFPLLFLAVADFASSFLLRYFRTFPFWIARYCISFLTFLSLFPTF